MPLKTLLVVLAACIGWSVTATAGEGHDAGYDWAQDKDIVDPADCGGNSQSFIEGCEEAAQEAMDEREDEESEYDDESDDESDY